MAGFQAVVTCIDKGYNHSWVLMDSKHEPDANKIIFVFVCPTCEIVKNMVVER